MLKIIECPRDAMQGLHVLIPTEKKIEYRENNASKQYYLQYCAAFVNEFIFYINN